MRLFLMSSLFAGLVLLGTAGPSYADDNCIGCVFDCSDACNEANAEASAAQSSAELTSILNGTAGQSYVNSLSGSYSLLSGGGSSSSSLSSFGLNIGSNGSIGLNLGFLTGSSSSTSVASAVGSTSGSTIGDLLCNVAYWFMGSIGQGIATLAVIVLGIGALMGKVSHGMVLVTLVGIAVIFGAPGIVEDLTGQTACYG